MDMALDSIGQAYVVYMRDGTVYLKEPMKPELDVIADLGVAGYLSNPIVDVACAFLPGDVLQLRGVDAIGQHYYANRQVLPAPGGWSGYGFAP